MLTKREATCAHCGTKFTYRSFKPSTHCSKKCRRLDWYRTKGHEREIARGKRWRTQNPEKYKECKKRYYWANREKISADAWDDYLIRTYGITAEYYSIECKARQNKCDICGKRKRLRVDHDHTTGEIRGFLCSHCNFVLGHAKDNAAVLKKAADYLK